MTLHLLDVAPIDDSEYRQMQQEKQMFQQANYQLYQENHSLRVELEKFQNMTPKEFKKYYKAKQKAQQTADNVTALTSENNINLNYSPPTSISGLRQDNRRLQNENQYLRDELEKFQNMTPKEFKQYYKAKQEDQQTGENVAAPFSSLTSEDNIDLSHSNQATTTEHTVAAAGFGYDGGASSNLLSSIVIVGVSICLCVLGAVAYRKHNK